MRKHVIREEKGIWAPGEARGEIVSDRCDRERNEGERGTETVPARAERCGHEPTLPTNRSSAGAQSRAWSRAGENERSSRRRFTRPQPGREAASAQRGRDPRLDDSFDGSSSSDVP